MKLTPKHIKQAHRHLRASDPVMKAMIDAVGPFTLRFERNRFGMLVRSIVSQQISTSAARSIGSRLRQLVGPGGFTAANLIRFDGDQLRSVGLSGQKASYMADLASKVNDGTVNLGQIGRLSDERIVEQLTQVKGIGHWTAQMFLIFALGRPDVFPHGDLGVRAYQGYLNESCATMAEVLGSAGYRTMMSGKWHVGGGYDNRRRLAWTPGDETHPLPRQRGFDRYFGLLDAADSYWNPKSLVGEDTIIGVESDDFHLTDAISDHAVDQISEATGAGKPFFQYVAFTAPHWPLHAREEDIARYQGRYMGGWDELRTSRHEEMMRLGIVDRNWEISPRDEDAPPWEAVDHKEWHDLRMAVYCAQIEQVDRGIGRILATLRKLGQSDNTLIMFLSDNGGCAELFQEDTDWPDPSQWETQRTLGNEPVRVGNIPEIRPGPDTSFQSVELPWANASNAPFRLFKRWVHEGGISTPFVVNWPARLRTPRS